MISSVVNSRIIREKLTLSLHNVSASVVMTKSQVSPRFICTYLFPPAPLLCMYIPLPASESQACEGVKSTCNPQRAPKLSRLRSAVLRAPTLRSNTFSSSASGALWSMSADFALKLPLHRPLRGREGRTELCRFFLLPVQANHAHWEISAS